MKRLFVNRKDSATDQIDKSFTPNPGDYWCTPMHYWQEFRKGDWVDIMNIDSVDLNSYDQIIVGGGGLLGNDNFDPYIQQLLPHVNRVWFWAPGINSNIQNNKETTQRGFVRLVETSRAKHYNLKGFDSKQITVRDYNQTYNYLPCVTCMHPVFDDVGSEITQDHLILAHNKVSTLLKETHPYFQNKKRIVQPETEIDEIVKEIKRSKYIVTNSYHGAYWSMLCNKPVVIVSPWTNKFLFFKHQPDIITINELSLMAMKELYPKKQIDCYDFTSIETYPDYLEECRTTNREFYLKVTAQ